MILDRYSTDVSRSEVWRLGAEFGTEMDPYGLHRLYWFGIHLGHTMYTFNFW